MHTLTVSRRRASALVISAVIATLPMAGLPILAAQPIAAAADRDPSAEATALVEAARSNHRVEVIEEQTETETVWANPDGTVSVDVSQVPVRVRDDHGKLVPIDTDLSASEGRLEPKASPSDVSLSATGDGTLASLKTANGTSVGLAFADEVSKPTVADDTATYPVSEAGDGPPADSVTVTATASGFTARVQLDQAPTEAPTYVFPLHLNGLSASLEQNSLMLRDAADKLMAQSAPLRMWDSSLDVAGDRANQKLVDATLVTIDGVLSLKLVPSMAWLTDPGTKYPVTVDPDVTSTLNYNRDTYYFEGQASGDPRGLDAMVRVGSDTGSRRFRSYLEFDTDAYQAKNVTSATLNLYQYYAGTCSPRSISARPTATKAVQNVTWNSPAPSHNNDLRYRSNKSFNHSTSCSPGYEPIDVTPTVRAWASGDLTRTAIGMIAGDELDTSYEKRFCSNDYDTSHGSCNSVNRRPTLTITYETPTATEDRVETSVEYEDGSELITDAETGDTYTTAATNGSLGRANMSFVQNENSLAEPDVDSSANPDEASLTEGNVPTNAAGAPPPAGYVYTDEDGDGQLETYPADPVLPPGYSEQGDTETEPADGTTDPEPTAPTFARGFAAGLQPIAARRTPNGYHLFGNNVSAYGYLYKSALVKTHLRKTTYVNGVRRETKILGTVEVSFKERLNGGNSNRWTLTPRSAHRSGPMYNADYVYYCGVNINNLPDPTCRTDDGSADGSGEEDYIARQSVGTDSWALHRSFGRGHANKRKYPMFKMIVKWPGYENASATVKMRGWDIRRYKGVWKMSPVSGTGY